MKHTGRQASLFVNGIPELLILRLLKDEEMYGYQIVRAIQRSTNDALSFGEGCVYPLLRSLNAQGMLHTRRDRVDGRTRIYYRLAPRGTARLDAMSGEWGRVSRAVGMALEGNPGR
jgi:PadR family transcriptional regulator, regulatory protein PadR